MAERLDIDALRALKAIADHGGVTRAAKHLSLSQSAVSHKIRRLEESIDCALLSRRPGAPLLTDAGERLLSYAERILNIHDEAVRSLSKRTLAGKIRLGMTEDTTSGGLARILARFAQLHPSVSVRTHVAQSLVLQRELEERQIDIAVMQIFAADVQASDIVLFQESLHWVRSLDCQIDAHGQVPFLAFDEDCFYRHWAMENGATRGWRLETILECASAAGIGAAVEAGMGISLLNERYVTSSMEVVDYLFTKPPDIAYIVRPSSKTKSGAVRALAREIAHETGRPHALEAA